MTDAKEKHGQLHTCKLHSMEGLAWAEMGGLLAEIMKNMCVQMQRENTHIWAKETHTHGQRKDTHMGRKWVDLWLK